MERLEIKVDTPTCTGCRICEMVCTLWHESVVNSEKARVRVSDKWEESLFEPGICRLCGDAPCVSACPTVALSQEEDSGLIRVDDELCNGCLACVEACPYDAIRYSDELSKLFVCDRCDGDPNCVKFCTIGTLTLVA